MRHLSGHGRRPPFMGGDCSSKKLTASSVLDFLQIICSYKEHGHNHRMQKSSKSFGDTYCFMTWRRPFQTCRIEIARVARCFYPTSTQRDRWLNQRRGTVGSPVKKKSRKSCYDFLLFLSPVGVSIFNFFQRSKRKRWQALIIQRGSSTLDYRPPNCPILQQ